MTVVAFSRVPRASAPRSSIGQPEVDDHPPALPYPPVMEKTLLPPAIAHRTVGGNSLNLSTETG